jgi:MFS transporter, MHS family, proline/betaine transporter
VRYTGTALATNLSVVIAGGTAPYIAIWLVAHTHNLRSPFYFVATTSIIGLLAVWSIWKSRGTTAKPAHDRRPAGAVRPAHQG